LSEWPIRALLSVRMTIYIPGKALQKIGDEWFSKRWTGPTSSGKRTRLEGRATAGPLVSVPAEVFQCRVSRSERRPFGKVPKISVQSARVVTLDLSIE